MSTIFKPLTVTTLPALQQSLQEFIDQPDLIGEKKFDNFISIIEGVTKLMTMPSFADSLSELKLTPAMVAGGTTITYQSSTAMTAIYNNNNSGRSYKYNVQIPITPCANAFINFYESSSDPILVTENGYEYFKYEPENCTLIERHSIPGALIFNGTIPRAIENDPAEPRHYLSLGVPAEFNSVIENLFGFPT